MERPRALLITGTAGSGKTAVALDIAYLLPSRGLAVAVIDVDWLGLAWLGPNGDTDVAELRMRNLALVWPNFRAAGVTHLVIAHAVRSREQVESVREALRGADITVVRLAVSLDEVAKRLRRRDTGIVLEEHLSIAASIAGDLDHTQVEDFIVGNEGRTVRATAMEVLRLIHWMTD